YVCSNLKESFGIDCRRKHILDLDSSTDTKFSRHLIFHMPGAVFKDNVHAGNFVHQICSELHETFRFITSPNTDESDLPSKTPRLDDKSSPSQNIVQSSGEDAMTGYELSPYPSIDEFVRTVIDRDGVQGHIRKWVYFPQGKLLMFDIGGNKWCENIGRQHKSNHIMIVADLRHGVYYQKCYDPDCKRIDYRSQDRAIPEELCPFQRDITDLEKSIEKELDEDDSDLCEIADLTEREARHSEHAHEQEKQTLDPTLFEDEEDWKPWKDLPACSATSE
ncbi:predicted protein, partial [Nematostella vectensis]